MNTDISLDLTVDHQPDDTSCGPTCLQAVYRYHGLGRSLASVQDSTVQLEEGGTLAVHLGCDAIDHGFGCDIYTADLDLFDPTWFGLEPEMLIDKLDARRPYARDPRAPLAIDAYIEFLQKGGQIHCAEFIPDLIRRPLRRGRPLIAGLSATYLYRTARETNDTMDYDDIRGQPQGHFVVLCGYQSKERLVTIADPYQNNPLNDGPLYHLPIERLISAMALGAWTYDANLLVLKPAKTSESGDAR